ncbi:MAG TPA: hypothetical protein VN035_00050 [Microbacterium sp.]|nr:hypothetical protein [Microbacterium sp.]
MSIGTVQQQLSTPEGFAKAVTPKSGLYAGGLTSLIAGLFGIAMNIFQLGSASDWNWRLIFRYFFDAQAVEFTGSRAGRAEIWRFLYVYGPIVLVPLGVILLIVHFSTRRKNGATLFADFQSRGWVGRQRFTGLKVKNGNATLDVVYVSHPSIPDENFDAIVQQHATQIAALDKKSTKAASAAAVKAGILKGGISAAALTPGLPPEIVAAPVQGKGEFVAVVPPAPGTTGKYQVLPIKE